VHFLVKGNLDQDARYNDKKATYLIFYSHGKPYALSAVTLKSFGFCSTEYVFVSYISFDSRNKQRLFSRTSVTDGLCNGHESCSIWGRPGNVYTLFRCQCQRINWFFFLHVSSLRRQVTWAAIDFLHRSEIQRGTFFRFHFTRTNSPPNNKPVLDFESHCVSENSCNFCGTIFVVNL